MLNKQFQSRWAIVLMLCVCFISIAIYTPLHKHGPGGICSLNHVDNCQPDGVEEAILPEPPAVSALFEVTAVQYSYLSVLFTRIPARSPPALSV